MQRKRKRQESDENGTRPKPRSALDAETRRLKDAHQELANLKDLMKEKKDKYKAAKEDWRKEKASMKATLKTCRDRLASTTVTLQGRLDQAQRREDGERSDKEEMKRLNKQLSDEKHRIQRKALEAKKVHKQWRSEYSNALSEKRSACCDGMV
jgi:ribosomal protein L32E